MLLVLGLKEKAFGLKVGKQPLIGAPHPLNLSGCARSPEQLRSCHLIRRCQSEQLPQ